MKSILMNVALIVCVCTLFLHHVTAAPVSANQITEKDRQDIIHYAAKIIRLLLRPDDFENAGPIKRNSGMLDAVMNMPDLMGYGRK